jgi:uncharacterized damage-inducible protein DinB
MAETAADYTRRITGYVEDRDPLTIVRETPVRLRELLDTTPAEPWRVRPAPGRWSPAEIMAHLADAETVLAWRFRMILSVDGVPIQAYDQNVWADAFKYADVEPRESLALFTAVRQGTLSVLERVDADRHRHQGMHAERGAESVVHLIRMWAGHDLNHLGQIEKGLGVGG